MKKAILIVGAGLAGLALYRTLDKQKFDIQIIEKRSDRHSIGFGVYLLPPGIKALQQLSMSASEIQALGKPYQEFQKRDQKGLLKDSVDYRPLISDFGPFLQVSREKIYQSLSQQVPDSAISLNTTISSLKQNKENVLVAFNNGNTSAFDLVIGADGAHSSIRPFIDAQTLPQRTGVIYTWAWIPKRVDTITQPTTFDDGHSGVGILDVGDPDRLCVFFWVPTNHSPDHVSSEKWKSFICEQFCHFEGVVPSLLDHMPPANELYNHFDHELKLTRWNNGRVGLIGDAAHALAVYSALGTSLALHDGLFLAKLLNDDEDFSAAFREFEQRQQSLIQKATLENLLDKNKNLSILREVFSESTETFEHPL